MFGKNKQTMYKILKPILLRFLSTTGCKEINNRFYACDMPTTSNTLDDRAVDLLEQKLFPKLN